WLFLIYWMLSDILFGLFWLALAWRWQSEDALRTPQWWATTGGLMSLMFLTRTAALAPMAALALIAVWCSVFRRGGAHVFETQPGCDTHPERAHRPPFRYHRAI